MHRIAGRTDIGCKRSHNEDAFGISRVGDGYIVVVADGMGGHSGGEVASDMAVDSYITELTNQLDGNEPVKFAMSSAGNVAHCAIRQKARDEKKLATMGTTLVAAWVDGDLVSVAHAGDSRCYLLSQGLFRQLTVDHSVVQEMYEGGAITEEEMEKSPMKNLLTNSLGAAQEIVEFSFLQRQVFPGDKLLLCSDGLTNTLTDDEILALLNEEFWDVDHCAERMIEESLENGARDNVTVVIVEITSMDD
jgi:protein phosphatase